MRKTRGADPSAGGAPTTHDPCTGGAPTAQSGVQNVDVADQVRTAAKCARYVLVFIEPFSELGVVGKVFTREIGYSHKERKD